VLLLVLVAAFPLPARAALQQPAPSRYLYVWTGDTTGVHSDVLAVFDVRPASPRYGRLLVTVPVGATHLMPHHTELRLPLGGQPFFANGYRGRRTFLFDWKVADRPQVVREVDSTPGFHALHSFARLADGQVLATVQFGNAALPGNPGGLVRFDTSGRVIRTASSADPHFPGARIRTYSLEVMEPLDRVVTTSAPMDTERTADVIQIWRLSDLRLLATLPVRGIPGDSVEYDPFEARVLGDGRTVFLNTYNCGLYAVTGLDSHAPAVSLVHVIGGPRVSGCSVPVVVGRYWIIPIAYGHVIVTFDVSDPQHPAEVARLATDSTFFPHWLGKDPGSDRLIVTDQGDGPGRMLMARLDPGTGRLAWDEAFRADSAGPLGFDFAHLPWPDGTTGPAMPHAALFRP
jgi:hypothetical protein